MPLPGTASTLRCRYLPRANGWLPSALSLAGITHLVVSSGHHPVPCWWQSGQHRIALIQHQDDQDPEPDRIHTGLIDIDDATDGAGDPSLRSLLDIARLEDAAAVTDGGTGASWSHLLAALGSQEPLRVPPVTGRLPAADSADLVAWNPLPMTRVAPVLYPVRQVSRLGAFVTRKMVLCIPFK